MRPGYNDIIFSNLKKKLDSVTDDREKIVVIIFDEMSLHQNFYYEKKRGCIIGVEDWGLRKIHGSHNEFESSRSYKYATNATVYMIKSIFTGKKMAIHYSIRILS